MSSCLSDADLLRFESGDMDEDAAAQVLGHMEECPRCAERGSAVLSAQEALLNVAREVHGSLGGRATGLPADSTLQGHRGVTSQSSLTGPRLGESIGPYRLDAILGEGGFGIVYEAAQQRPIRRSVALKVIKAGMDSQQIIGRFEAERQALALMDHVGVAKVLDAGTTDAGRPYFVMELVKGTPITNFCDRNTIPLRQRLELFVEVCEAIKHAHQKGIIHRDLKPSNVLVAAGDRLQPKVIDFGIAKAIGDKLTDATMYTQAGQFMGTPEYMSPEQAEGSGQGIDTRTDIYSLGVILFELLTARLPFESNRLRTAGLTEMLRIIREEEPPRPSQTFAGDTGLHPGQPDFGAQELRSDLDWIVLRALEKDAARRYQSVSEFAEDIRRFLRSEVVLASPPSTAYRVRKFIRRHRFGVAAGSAVVLALVAGVIGTGWMAIVAEREKEAAVAARKDAEEISEFQSKMLEQIIPQYVGVRLRDDLAERFEQSLSKGELPEADLAARRDHFQNDLREVNFTSVAADLVDRTILTPAIEAVDAQFADRPLTAADLRETLATIYEGLGKPKIAIELQRGILETRRKLLPGDSPKIVRALNNSSILMMAEQRYDEGEATVREALERSKRYLSPDDPLSMRALTNLGAILDARGKFKEAKEVLKQAVEVRQRVHGPDGSDTLTAKANLAGTLQSLGEFDEAEQLHREVLAARRRVLGNEHRDTIKSISNLGYLLKQRGKLDEVEPLYREALALMRQVLGENHPDTLSTMSNLGALLGEKGKMEEAEGYYRDVLEKRRRLLPENHPHTLISINNMGFFLFKQGKREEAGPYFEEAVERFRRVLGTDHYQTLVAIENLGGYYKLMNRPAEAEPLYREALAIRARGEGQLHTNNLLALTDLAIVLSAQGKHEEAKSVLLEALNATDHDNAERRAALIKGLIATCESWHKADPTGGHSKQADEWRSQLESDSKSQSPG